MVVGPSTSQQPEDWVNQWLSGVWFLIAGSSILSLSAMSNAVNKQTEKNPYKRWDVTDSANNDGVTDNVNAMGSTTKHTCYLRLVAVYSVSQSLSPSPEGSISGTCQE